VLALRPVYVTAKVEYAVRALVELAAAPRGAAVKSTAIAKAQDMPRKFLENILAELRTAGFVVTQRGPGGGSLLARDPDDITLAEVFRALEGPLAAVRGVRPEHLNYAGAARPLADVWIAVRASLRQVLEHVTLADIVEGRQPAVVRRLIAQPGSRAAR
jgi:Rrf2 family protein